MLVITLDGQPVLKAPAEYPQDWRDHDLHLHAVDFASDIFGDGSNLEGVAALLCEAATVYAYLMTRESTLVSQVIERFARERYADAERFFRRGQRWSHKPLIAAICVTREACELADPVKWAGDAPNWTMRPDNRPDSGRKKLWAEYERRLAALAAPLKKKLSIEETLDRAGKLVAFADREFKKIMKLAVATGPYRTLTKFETICRDWLWEASLRPEPVQPPKRAPFVPEASPAELAEYFKEDRRIVAIEAANREARKVWSQGPTNSARAFYLSRTTQ
jgi:hypothetical protein